MTPTQTPDQTELELEARLEREQPQTYKEFYERYNHCVFCGKGQLSCHHVKFKSQGGGDTKENECPLCPSSCHLRAHEHVVAGLQPFKVTRMPGGWIAATLDGEVLKEMSDKPHEPTELQGQEYFTLNESIRANEATFKESGTALGKQLAYMFESGLYKSVYEKWADYLLDNLTIGYSMANRLRSGAEGQAKYALPDEAVEGIAIDKMAFVYSAAESRPEKITEFVEIARTTPGLKEVQDRIRMKIRGDETEPEIPDPSKPDPCPKCQMECCPTKRGIV